MFWDKELTRRASESALRGRPLLVLTPVPSALDVEGRRRLTRLGWNDPTGVPGRVESLVGRALARRLVAIWANVELDEVRIGLAPGGRPYATLADGSFGPFFNVTHSGQFVAAAVSSAGCVGVDIEAVDTCDRRVLERVFAPTDVARVLALAGSERDREFARLWTVAEACAKATGEGLRRLLRRLDPIGDADDGAWSGGPLTWAVAEPAHGYVCAIASDAPVVPSDITGLVDVPFVWIAGSATDRGHSVGRLPRG